MSIHKSDETTPLLGDEAAAKADYVTFPDPCDEDGVSWVSPRGFWWIETALWANVFLSGFDSTITASTYALVSSDFDAANEASWLTTSYLITCTAFQPLYGRFSDVFGRRACFFVCTVTFMAGCLGCAAAPTMLELVLMRALTGFGGGGLITMATIINSDMIPFRHRGMYQAMQNVLVGFGAILAASLGGMIAESIGWRWCFLLQVPVSLLALFVGYLVLENPRGTLAGGGERLRGDEEHDDPLRSRWSRWQSRLGGWWSDFVRYIDITGATVLVMALVLQLAGLSLGGNEFAWCSAPVVASLAVSVAMMALFVVTEARTTAMPVIPLGLLSGWQPAAVQLSNVFSGMCAYAYMFMIPLYFQAVLGESPSAVGIRLVFPSLSTLVGGVIAGYLMHHGCGLAYNVRFGTALMLVGNLLAVRMPGQPGGSWWMETLCLVPANVGVGMTNPSLLFSVIRLFEHKEQAVATSTVYLIRSMGNIYGVTLTSAVVQNALVAGLPVALGDIAGKDQIVERLRRSVFALDDLPPDLRAAARGVYCNALRIAFGVSAAFALLSFAFSFAVKSRSLKRGGGK
ncbi:hypothetical protein VTK73DRAFT_9127 [Phialemonium thermophilum]|uniref:Major facilitator superfamily (MFS) profile domain-containing protein n=1 Tax=Phialemonium thermophilum TaxID=223376 RepID=A0ABR3W4D6_9PEZI